MAKPSYNRPALIFLGISIVIIFSALSCEVTGETCGPFPDKFTVTGLSASVKQATESESFDPQPQLNNIQNDSVRADQFAITIYPEAKYFFSEAAPQNRLHLIPAAYACSPTEPVTDELITGIEIYSEQDFNSEYTAGSDLAELFDVVAYYMKTGGERYDLPAFLSRKPNVPDWFTLLLTSPPEEEKPFSFTVKYFQDGENLQEFEFSTEYITLLLF